MVTVGPWLAATSFQQIGLQYTSSANAGFITGFYIIFESCTFAHIKAGAGALAYAGFMSVGVAFTLQVVCQKRCPPGPAAVIMSMEAVFAALAGYIVLDQTLTGRAMLGCALILCGVLIVQLVPIVGRKSSDSTEST